MTKLQDIAEACGVSISTVSLALHKPHRISRDKKDEILHKAQELGYFSKNKTVTRILLICSNFFKTYSSEYYNRVICGILEVLHKENIMLQIVENFNDVFYEQIYENNGIIFLDKTPPEYIEKALEFKLPFILCGHPDNQYKYPSAHVDIKKGIHDLLEYVISAGHKKIGLIIGHSDNEDFFYKNIIDIFRSMLQRNHLPSEDKMIATCSYENLQTVEIALNKLLKQNPTAIYCADDHIAYAAYQTLKNWGIKIPEDISIVGFDGITTPDYLPAPEPVLTTVCTDPILLGRRAVDQLKKMILNPQGITQKHVVLPVQLRIGASVKRKKG